VQATVLPDGNYYLPASDESIPADMARPSPDDRFHRCAFNPVATVTFIPGIIHYWEANPRPDASLLQWILLNIANSPNADGTSCCATPG
jgi:hypothetical protein